MTTNESDRRAAARYRYGQRVLVTEVDAWIDSEKESDRIGTLTWLQLRDLALAFAAHREQAYLKGVEDGYKQCAAHHATSRNP